MNEQKTFEKYLRGSWLGGAILLLRKDGNGNYASDSVRDAWEAYKAGATAERKELACCGLCRFCKQSDDNGSLVCSQPDLLRMHVHLHKVTCANSYFTSRKEN